MNLLLALSPDEFQKGALLWIGSILAVSTALFIAAATILPKIAALVEQVKALGDVTKNQGVSIRENRATIAQIALATPPPAVVDPNPPQL